MSEEQSAASGGLVTTQQLQGHDRAAIVGVLRHWDDPVDVGCQCKECMARKSLSDPEQIVSILAELLRGFGFGVWIDAAPRTRPPSKDEFAFFLCGADIQMYLPSSERIERSRLLVMPQARAITLQLLSCATAAEALVVCFDECHGSVVGHERKALTWALRAWRDMHAGALALATSDHETSMPAEREILRTTNDPMKLAEFIVAEATRCGFDAVVAHETTQLESAAWLVLTPFGEPNDGGISVYVETGTTAQRNRKGSGRGWNLPTARQRLAELLDVQDGACADAERIFRTPS